MGKRVQCPVCGNVFRAVLPKVILLSSEPSDAVDVDMRSPSSSGNLYPRTTTEEEVFVLSEAGSSLGNYDPLENFEKSGAEDPFEALEVSHQEFLDTAEADEDEETEEDAQKDIDSPRPQERRSDEPDGWYIQRKWGEEGPLRGRELVRTAREGRIYRRSKVRHSRRKGWFFAGKVPGLFAPKGQKQDVPETPKEKKKRQKELSKSMDSFGQARQAATSAAQQMRSSGLDALAGAFDPGGSASDSKTDSLFDLQATSEDKKKKSSVHTPRSKSSGKKSSSKKGSKKGKKSNPVNPLDDLSNALG